MRWRSKCPTCGNPHIQFREVQEDGSVYIQWMCGHQRGVESHYEVTSEDRDRGMGVGNMGMSQPRPHRWVLDSTGTGRRLLEGCKHPEWARTTHISSKRKPGTLGSRIITTWVYCRRCMRDFDVVESEA